LQIQINTGNQIEGGTELTLEVEAVVEDALGRFHERITRVEVFLSDENSSQKSDDTDMRCVMEVRLSGMQPIVVTADGSSLEQALNGAANKLKKTLKRTLGRLEHPKGRMSYAGDQS
jgi:ribosome-associated translation inhibitor RaiA